MALTVADDADPRAACSSPAVPGSSARATSATSSAGATARTITVLDKLTYAGNEANLAPVRDDPEHGRPASRSCGATSPIRRSSGRSSRDADAVVNFAAESHVDRSILDPEAFLATGVIGVHVLLEACRDRAGHGRASCRSRPTRSTARSTRATPPRTRRSRRARRTPRPRRPASCSSGATSSPTASTPSSPAARTRTGRTTIPRSSSRCSSPTPSTTGRCRSTATASSGATGCTSRTTPAAIDYVLRHGVTGETYNVAGPTETDQPRRRRAAARAARQAVVARPAGRGPAGPRPALRDGRLEAGGARLAAADVVRGRPGGDGRLVPRQRGVVAGGPVGRLGRLVRAPVRPAPGDRASGRRERADPRLMRVAVTGRGRPARAARSSRPSPTRRSPARPGRSPGPRDAFDLDAPDGDRRAASTATGPRSSSTPRPGPTSTAAPATRSWRSGATAIGDRRPRRGLRRARDRPADRLDERGLRRDARTDGRGYRPTTRPRPAIRTAHRSSRASGSPTAGVRPRSPAPRSGSPGRPGCSGRPGATSRAGSSTPPSARAAAGEPLRVVGDEWGTPTYTADVADAIVELLAEDAVGGIHHLVNGAVASRADWARDVVARAGLDVEVENVPASTWERPSHAAALGRPGADAAAVRRAAAAVAATRWPTTRRDSCAQARARA